MSIEYCFLTLLLDAKNMCLSQKYLNSYFIACYTSDNQAKVKVNYQIKNNFICFYISPKFLFIYNLKIILIFQHTYTFLKTMHLKINLIKILKK